MACYHPLRAVYLYGTTDNGKRQVRVLKEASTENRYVYQNRHKPDILECSPDRSLDDRFWRPLNTFEVPCGKCVGCRLDYSRKWATRLMMELPYHEQSFFVTLTYNNDNLPIGDKGMPTLVPDDVSDFLKRLRREQDYHRGGKIRFFAAGEYGSQTARPHYHLILFGWTPPEGDLVKLSYSNQGHPYYRSLLIERLWPYGYNVVGGVSWQSCAYVARYILKKQKGDAASIYDDHGIEPEFVRMSRMPGIGYQYYEDHKDDMLLDGYVQLTDGMRAPLPHYFDPFFERDYEAEYDGYREHREEQAKLIRQVREFGTELDYYEQLLVDEDAKIRKSKMLVRPVE